MSEPFTTVVSGFPRSGTSAMMRMLTMGGLPPIIDKKFLESQNKFDSYGALEKENVAQATVDMKPDYTNGKVVKIVAPYITWLPLDRPLKIIFMLRDINEIIASLLAMDVVWEDVPADSISTARKFIDEYILPVHYVHYNDMIRFPRATATGIKDFLQLDLNVDAMVKAVDPQARGKGKDKPGIERPTIVMFGVSYVDAEKYNTRNFIQKKEEG